MIGQTPTHTKYKNNSKCLNKLISGLLAFFGTFLLFSFIIDHYGEPVDLNKIQPMSPALDRHQDLLRKNSIVGKRMKEVKEGKIHVEDIVGGVDGVRHEDEGDGEEPMSIEEILEFLNGFISNLHKQFVGHYDEKGEFHDHKHYNYRDVWKLFHDYALEGMDGYHVY